MSVITRLIQRNAHLFTTLSIFWSVFSLFAILEWRDARRYFGDANALPDLLIWSLHLLFIFFAFYYSKTEKPCEVLWIGETTGSAWGYIGLEDFPLFLEDIRSLVNGRFTQDEIAQVLQLAQAALIEGEAKADFTTEFRGKKEKLEFLIEDRGDNVVEIVVSTHPDLADQIDECLQRYDKDREGS